MLVGDQERWLVLALQKAYEGSFLRRVFGVPLETVVQRQRGSRAVPQIVINCVDYISTSGLNAENIFKSHGNQQVVQNLRYCFEEGKSHWSMVIPNGTSPLDVAALLKRYLQMLPEPLLTYPVYNEIKEARGNVQQLADLLRTIPYAHYSTLECITLLLFQVSQKSGLNKMDAHSLAFELAPYLLWKQKTGPHDDYQPYFLHDGRSLTHSRVQDSDYRDVNSVIPLDDEPMMADFAIIEAVQCLIEQQKVIFAEPTEAIWHESGE
ncbi:hypothetical protein L7F22_044803 [Adiantum nelumboides]|nr:hypothetical protein [Adiantum nelumboides]